MNPVDVLPYLTGAGGAIFALITVISFLLTGVFVTRREHQRALDENEKLREANETLRDALQVSQQQIAQLTNSAQVTVELMSVLKQVAQERTNP